MKQYTNKSISNFGYDDEYLNERYPKNSTEENSYINSNNSNNKLFKIREFKSILDSKYYLIKKIGEGSFGKVYLGIDTFSEKNDDIKYYSIKIMKMEKVDIKSFENEYKLLSKINHKNICKIFAYGSGLKISLNKAKNKQPKKYYYIVMGCSAHGELFKYINNVFINENLGFGEDFGRLIFAQLLDGLQAIHNLNICHQDIKLDNIVLAENDYILKYIDFGLATEEQGKLSHFLGTPRFAAPEIYLKEPYYGKTEDIFSLGVTLFILVTGKLPFKIAWPNYKLYNYIARGDYVGFWQKQFMNISASFMELFDNMIALDFSQRPSISEIKNSSWMKEIDWGLLPLLKQEFILREEKININNKNIGHKFRINKFKINISADRINESLIKSSYIKNKVEGKIEIKTGDKNLCKLFRNIKKYLKNAGFYRYEGNDKIHELKLTNGETDIYLHLKKYKLKYIILNYSIKKGTFQFFEKFQYLLNNIKKIIIEE